MKLAALSARITPILSRRSFTRRGSAFHKKLDDNIVSIALNRSSRSTSTALIVAVEMGITVAALARLQDCEVDAPDADWDYSTRMASSSHDDWWTLRDSDASLQDFERALEDVAVPNVEALAVGRRLCDLFLTDRRLTGLSGPRLQVRIALLAEHGPHGDLPVMLNELATKKYPAARGQAERLAAALRQRGIDV